MGNISEKKEIQELNNTSKKIDISRLKVGESVAYAERVYSVVAYAEYDWGEGFITQEWRLQDGEKDIYLRREKEEDIFLTISEPQENENCTEIYSWLKKNVDPPEPLKYDGKDFFLVDSGAGRFCPDGVRPGKDCVMWLMADKEEKSYLTIFQWNNNLFSCFLGKEISEQDIVKVPESSVTA